MGIALNQTAGNEGLYLPLGDQVRALWPVLEPVVRGVGFELCLVELASDRTGLVVRVYIDQIRRSSEPIRFGPEDSVSIDDCTTVSRQLSRHLDALEEEGRDPLPGAYRLEVSSPGIFRPLSRRWHFDAAVETPIKVRTRAKVGGRRSFQGALTKVHEDEIELRLEEGNTVSIPRAELSKATWDPPFDKFGPRKG